MSTAVQQDRRPSIAAPVAVAIAAAVAYLVVSPPSADLAAQAYRAELFDRVGFTLWDNGWFSGHHMPGYSLLFPPLGALLGPRLVGALAATAAAALFAHLSLSHWGHRALPGAVWFAGGTGALLLTGRMTYTLGVALGLAALVLVKHEKPRAAAATAALSTLASPVAGVFVALAVTAWGLTGPKQNRTKATGIAAAALAPALVLAALFPEGGDQPFIASAFWPVLAGIAIVGAVLPGEERTLKAGAALYAIACLGAFLIASPLGGNVARLGELTAGPLAACVLSGRTNPRLLAAVALPLMAWQLSAPVREVVRATGDPSTKAAYYDGPRAFLQTRPDAGGFRVEVPFTLNHWETAHLADDVPLARGWERQLDRRLNPLFYDGRLTENRYKAWLHHNGVRYIALPDARLDASGEQEAALIRTKPNWLTPVWNDAHWQVFRVAGANSLVDGLDADVRLQPDGFTLRARRAGTALVRVNHTRWWSVEAGSACVSKAANGMTRVVTQGPGIVRITARMDGASCR